MIDLTILYEWISTVLPFEIYQPHFMIRALIGLTMLAPMAAMMGVQVVNFRMAFFADAISHTSFAGVAVGLLLGISPYWSMPMVSLIIGFSIVAMGKKSMLSADSVVGVFFSGVVAFGLAVVSRSPGESRNIQRYLYGNILTIKDSDILFLTILLILLIVFQVLSYNKLLYLGLNPTLAKTHRVKVSLFQYLYAGLLSLVVVFSVWWVGVLLVTGLLIIPAAAARNFAKSSGSMFRISIYISLLSAVIGLSLSASPGINTAAGATVILVSLVFFALSSIYSRFVKH